MRHWILTDNESNLVAKGVGRVGIQVDRGKFDSFPDDLIAKNGNPKYRIEDGQAVANNIEDVYPIAELRRDKEKAIRRDLLEDLRDTKEKIDRHDEEKELGLTTTLNRAEYLALLQERKRLRDAAEALVTVINTGTREEVENA